MNFNYNPNQQQPPQQYVNGMYVHPQHNVNYGQLPPQPYAQPAGVSVSMPGYMSVSVQPSNGMYTQPFAPPQPYVQQQPQTYVQPQPQVYSQPSSNYSSTISVSTSGFSPSPQMSSGGSLTQQILAACRGSSFDSDKINAIQNCASSQCGPISAKDLSLILNFFGMDNDKVKVLNILKQSNNIALMTGTEASSIIRLFNFDNDKIRGLEAIVASIYDRKQNQAEEAVVAAFGFSDDINRARNLMQTR